MKFFKLALTGDPDDKALAFVQDPPEELGIRDYYMRKGIRMGDLYPPDVKLRLSKRAPGIKLSSLLGNTLSYLILNSHAKDIFVKTGESEIETLPFTLINHKGRVHSKDYWILNPIGTFDCVNRDASKIKYLDETKKDIVGIAWAAGSLVFDSKKMQNAPDLFRVPEKPSLIFMSERLARAAKTAQLSNVLPIEDMRIEPSP